MATQNMEIVQLVLVNTSRFSVFEAKIPVNQDSRSMVKANSKAKAKIKSKTKSNSSPKSESTEITSSYEQLVDIDANLLHEALQDDILEIRQRCFRVGIKHLIVPGCTVLDSQKSLELSTSISDGPFANVYATVGIHPYSVPQLELLKTSMDDIERIIKSSLNACKAVGETGLDTSDGFPPLEQQIPYFENHVKLAKHYQLPLFLHQRGGFHELCDILKRHDFCGTGGADGSSVQDSRSVVIHCFTGSRKELEQYVAYGFYIGVTGYILRKNDTAVDELIRALSEGVVPLNKLMIETDAP